MTEIEKPLATKKVSKKEGGRNGSPCELLLYKDRFEIVGKSPFRKINEVYYKKDIDRIECKLFSYITIFFKDGSNKPLDLRSRGPESADFLSMPFSSPSKMFKTSFVGKCYDLFKTYGFPVRDRSSFSQEELKSEKKDLLISYAYFLVLVPPLAYIYWRNGIKPVGGILVMFAFVVVYIILSKRRN
jgi:hypothetical protein